MHFNNAQTDIVKIIPFTFLIKLLTFSIIYGMVDLILLLIFSKTISMLVGFSTTQVDIVTTIFNRLNMLQIITLLFILFMLKIFSFKLIISVAQSQREQIATTVLEKYLNLDYETFYNKPSGDIHANVTSEVDQLVQLMFMPFSKGIMALVTILSILTFIAINDLNLAFFLIILAGSSLRTALCQVRERGRSKNRRRQEKRDEQVPVIWMVG